MEFGNRKKAGLATRNVCGEPVHYSKADMGNLSEKEFQEFINEWKETDNQIDQYIDVELKGKTVCR